MYNILFTATVATNTSVNASAKASFSQITRMSSSSIASTATVALNISIHSNSFSVSLSQSSQTTINTLHATSNRVISNLVGISTLQSLQVITNTFVTTNQPSSHSTQSSTSLFIIPTTSSVYGITSSVQFYGTSQSSFLQTIASTFGATIQTSNPFPKTTKPRVYATTSEIGRSLPPSFQTSLDLLHGITETSILSPGTVIRLPLFSTKSIIRNEYVTSYPVDTFQTFNPVPSTIESALLSLKATMTSKFGTSNTSEKSASPSLQVIIGSAIASPDTNQSSLSPTVSDAYDTTSKVIAGSPSSPSADQFSGNSLRPTIIQSMRAEFSTSQLSTMTSEFSLSSQFNLLLAFYISHHCILSIMLHCH